MAYLTSYRGDYLASYRGDPFLHKTIFKVVKGAAGGFLSGGPLGAIRGAAGAFGGGAQQPRYPGGQGRRLARLQGQAGGPRGLPVPGLPGILQRAIPGGRTGFLPGARRRRMNPANPKALRRAIRRQASFVKLARRALKGSGYAITTRGSRRTRPINIRESGPGGVSVRG